jgi:hypothetical protein
VINATGWTYDAIYSLTLPELNDYLEYINENPPLVEQGLDQLLLVGLKLKRGGARTQSGGQQSAPSERPAKELCGDPRNLPRSIPRCGPIPEYVKVMIKETEELIRQAEAAERTEAGGTMPVASVTEPKACPEGGPPPLTTSRYPKGFPGAPTR